MSQKNEDILNVTYCTLLNTQIAGSDLLLVTWNGLKKWFKHTTTIPLPSLPSCLVYKEVCLLPHSQKGVKSLALESSDILNLHEGRVCGITRACDRENTSSIRRSGLKNTRAMRRCFGTNIPWKNVADHFQEHRRPGALRVCQAWNLWLECEHETLMTLGSEWWPDGGL